MAKDETGATFGIVIAQNLEEVQKQTVYYMAAEENYFEHTNGVK